MSWHKIELNADQMAKRETANVQDAFDILWITLGHPKDFALLHSKASTVPIIIYISPGASKVGASIIKKYQGTPCSAPPTSDAGLLIGYADAIETLLHS